MTYRSLDIARGRPCGLWAWVSASLAILVVTATALFATAQDAPWQVAEIAGDVRLLPAGGEPRPLAVGDAVGPGAVVVTGAAGRARLTRSGDAMTLSRNSQMTVPAAAAGPDATSVLQRLGTLLFEIDSRFGTDRFRVETPYLAAVIKGTVFTVTVGPSGGALSVVEGLVEVRRPGAAQPVLVQAGATVRAPADQGGRLDLIEPNGGSEPAPAEPGGGDRGGREDDRGQGTENAEGKGKSWKAGFDPGTGDIGESSKGLLNGNGLKGKAEGNGALTSADAPANSRRPVDGSPPGLVGKPINPSYGNTNAHGGNPYANGGNPNAGGPQTCPGNSCDNPGKGNGPK